MSLYSDIGLAAPAWAYPLRPSIPFVGKNYGRWGGLLVYGSAENLAQYQGGRKPRPPYLEDGRAGDRHRAALECEKRGFFPFVHMAPFDNGSLLVAIWYYLSQVGAGPPDDPYELIESIAAANFCKFSIGSETNKDHAGDGERVGISVPYVREDLRALEPAAVFLPRTIWNQSAVQITLLETAPKTRFIALPQFNAQVVNLHLARHEGRAQALATRMKGTVLASWVDRLRGYGAGRPYRFLVEIDDVLRG